MSRTRLGEAWKGFWFGSVPAEPYALLRISFGLLGLLNLFGTTPVEIHWALDGIVPRPGGGVGVRSLIASAGHPEAAGWAAFLGLSACFVAMTIGAATTWAVPCAYVGSLAQTFWNPLPLSAHKVLIAVLFSLMWVDSGRKFSVDAWLRRRRGVAAAEGPGGSLELPQWPLRLLQVQIAIVYLNSGLWKLFGEAWRNGSALQLATNVNLYRRFPVNIPTEMDWLATPLTYLTLFWEISFPVLVCFRTTRLAALLCGVAIHLGIMGLMEVGTFSLMMLATYVAFLPPSAVAAALRTGQRPESGLRM